MLLIVCSTTVFIVIAFSKDVKNEIKGYFLE